MSSLADMLGVVQERLEPLVTASATDRALAVARGWPPMQVMGFERPLNGTGSDVDMAASFQRGSSAFRRLAREPEGVDGVRQLLAAMADPASPLVGAGEDFWLEVDSGSGATSPSLFFRPAGDRTLSDLASGLNALRPGCVRPEAFGVLERLSAQVPDVDVFQVGVMIGRSGVALRICLTLSPTVTAERLAEALSTPRVSDVVRRAQDLGGSLVGSYVVCLDIAEGIGGRLGVEMGFGGVTGLISPRTWWKVLDRLVSAGYCRPDERDALVAWIGVSRSTDDESRWPDHMLSLAPIVAPYEMVLRRGISHLKLVESVDGVPSAKAYFGCRLSFSPVFVDA
jgi:hypothetical protein